MSFQRWVCHFRVSVSFQSECVISEVDVSFQSRVCHFRGGCVISEVGVSFQR